jgi:uncharacterized protein
VAGRLLDGAVLHRWLLRAVDGLEQAGPRIDAVNVFPVADQDTGTNCLLTLRGATEELARLAPGADPMTVLAAATRGALLAARGNSGMILSHWFAGLARGAELPIAGALALAAESARSAVLEPEPGTVLDLAAEVARAAREHAGTERERLSAALDAGHAALAEISARHPVLRDARVLDAGACALLVVLSAWAAAADDPDAGPGGRREGRPAPVELDLSWLPESAAATPRDHVLTGFEVMAVLPAGDDADLRARLAEIGDAVAVVAEPGDAPDRRRQSHVHTDDPSAAVAVLRAAAGSAPVLVVLHSLNGVATPVVAVTGSAERAREMARAGAVVLVAGPASAADWRLALERAVRDARAGGAHRDATAAEDPVPVLPGAWLTSCASAVPAGGSVLAEADDDERVLAVLHALAGEVSA